MMTAIYVIAAIVAAFLVVWAALVIVTRIVCKLEDKRRARLSEEQRRAED